MPETGNVKSGTERHSIVTHRMPYSRRQRPGLLPYGVTYVRRDMVRGDLIQAVAPLSVGAGRVAAVPSASIPTDWNANPRGALRRRPP